MIPLIINIETVKMSNNQFIIFRLVLINEERLKLEYELKQSSEFSNKKNSELRLESENLQQNLNEKYIILFLLNG